MKFIQVLRTVLIVCVVLGLGSLSIAAEKERAVPDKEKAQGTLHTVQAGVGYPTNAGVGIQAEKQPGSFTIPKGSQGAKLKYSFHDPKSDYTSTKLRGSNIYSVTEHRYMDELTTNPNFVLPPGEYKFVVGGQPGASGSLVYTIVTDSGVQPPPGSTRRDPPIHKPPSGTPGKDTSKTGSGSDTLHPGGEGRRRVTVFKKGTRVFTDSAAKDSHFEGVVNALLTITGDSFTLEFPLATEVPNIKTFNETWKGRLFKQQPKVLVSGTVLETIIYGGGGYVKGPGTFQGTLDGDRLSGTMEKKGEWDGGWGDGPKPFREEGEWSIRDFAK